MNDTAAVLPAFYGESDAKVWLECMIDTTSYFNYRFAFRDDSKAVIEYGYVLALPSITDTQVEYDFPVIVGGRRAMIGCTLS